VDVACLLIERGCSLGNFTTTLPDMLQNGENCGDVREMLKSLGKRLNEAKHGPFLVHRAVQQNDNKFLRALLEEGFDPNVRDEEDTAPLHHAIIIREPDRLAAVRLLTSHKADPNALLPSRRYPSLPGTKDGDYTPLVLASAVLPSLDVMKHLLSVGANPNLVLPQLKSNALLNVCAFNVEIGRCLIESGTDINHQSIQGHSVLYWSAVCNNIPLLNLVLSQPGIDVNVKLSDQIGGYGVLHTCVKIRKIEAMKVLLERGKNLGLDVNLKDGRNVTALSIAIQGNAWECVMMLQKAGAMPCSEIEKEKLEGFLMRDS